MAQRTPVTYRDLQQMAAVHKRERKEVKKIELFATKEEILRICTDEATHKHINRIRSATIDVDNVRFELIKKD